MDSLKLSLTEGQITKFIVRKDGQGDERQTAVDIYISVNAPDTVLDLFSASDCELKNTMYRGDGSPILEQIMPIKSKIELGSHIMAIHQPIGTEGARGAVCVVKELICEELVKFEFLPKEDNRVLLKFVAQCYPDGETHLALVRAFTETLTFDCQLRQDGLDFGEETVDGEVDQEQKALGEGTKALPEGGPSALGTDATVD